MADMSLGIWIIGWVRSRKVGVRMGLGSWFWVHDCFLWRGGRVRRKIRRSGKLAWPRWPSSTLPGGGKIEIEQIYQRRLGKGKGACHGACHAR